VPYQDVKTYAIQLWKQGGIDHVPTLFSVEGGEEKIDLIKDQVFKTSF
jgi:hypothetical protein